MDRNDTEARALFLSPDGSIYPDTLVCSGVIPPELDGQPCPFSEDGHLPDPVPLDSSDPAYSVDKGHPGELCPPCAKQQLANLGHWQGHGGQRFPEDMLSLRLFKCRQWFWMVVIGLYEKEPTKISGNGSNPSSP